MIKGFVFDLDGVITETANLHYKAWVEEIKGIGIYDFTEAENSTLKGLSRVDTLIAILKLKKMYEKFSHEQIIELANKKNARYVEILKTDLNKSNILPGVEKLLKNAKDNGIKMSIASSSYNAPSILEKIELIDYFDFIVNPKDIKNGKPAPDIFLAACKGIDLNPSEVIGFEDAIAGVKGLKDAKIKTVAITHGDVQDWTIADMVIQTTNELDFNKIMNM